MNISRLSSCFERAASISGVRHPRCLYDKTRPLDCRTHPRRTIVSSTRKGARLIDAHKSNDAEGAHRAQDQLDAIEAAPEIDFSKFKGRNNRPQKGQDEDDDTEVLNADGLITIKDRFDDEEGGASGGRGGKAKGSERGQEILRSLRVVPASPSYFTAKPRFTDDYVYLMSLMRRSQFLPTVKPGDQPRVAWQEFENYKGACNEPVKLSKYREMLLALRRMNMIHPQLMPEEVRAALDYWARQIQPSSNRPNPIEVDEHGRAAAVGRRKCSSAKAWLVEGDGKVMVNGKPLHEAFARTHDRESVIWALKVTQRLGRYNVWGMANGGGTTGQAEALTLAVSKALMAHEPALKTSLRIAGCVHRDPRMVERKKPGRVKARKRPTWVKR